MKERDNALKIALKSKLEHDRRRFTMLRNKVMKEIRQAKANFFINIIGEAKGNSKLIWENLKKLTGKDHSNTAKRLEIMVNNNLTQDAVETAIVFIYYFIDSVRVLTQNPSTCFLGSVLVNDTQPVFIIREVSESKVNKVISSLKNSKAKDVFGMDSTFLKNYKESLIGPITKVTNTSIGLGVFPRVWKSAIITAIFKSGDPANVSNYMPISILPVVSKVVEKCVAEQLIAHLNNSPFTLHSMQFGFRAKHSTETANCFLLENVKSKMDKGGAVGAVFLDLRKAFDTVNHEILITKLSKFNFSPDALRWMKSYLEGRTQCVRVSNELSPTRSYDVGVPQGSILGPLLFSLYINDLPSVCTGSEVQMYADDTVIYVHAKSKQQAAQELTTVMVQVTKWLSDSCLHLNVKKTVCMFFTKRATDATEPDVYVSGEKLQVVSDFKYLGIILDSNLCVKKVIQITKFNLANFRFIRNCLTTEVAKLYFKSMILPHLTYCLTSWAQACCTKLKPIQSVYKQALKVLDRKPNSHHHCHILRKHELLSWENLVQYTDACLVFKILNGLAPPPLNIFVKQKTQTYGSRSTRSAMRGDCIVPLRKSTFSKSAFSVRASHVWNTLPSDTHNCTTYHTFTKCLKTWLKVNQICEHGP
uniref:Reverse transcriptase domain-containing protein n=1 Tax=Oncorhynchus kisutch TaxID=8019 RepID=A0A8C7CP59_ONCKI